MSASASPNRTCRPGACTSVSIRQTRRPRSARIAATLTAKLVFPVPPPWLWNTRTEVMNSPCPPGRGPESSGTHWRWALADRAGGAAADGRARVRAAVQSHHRDVVELLGVSHVLAQLVVEAHEE